MGRSFTCPYCGLCDTVAKGFRRTKTMGLRRVRLCKVCGKKFTPRNQKPVEVIEETATEEIANTEQQAGPPDQEWTS